MQLFHIGIFLFGWGFHPESLQTRGLWGRGVWGGVALIRCRVGSAPQPRATPRGGTHQQGANGKRMSGPGFLEGAAMGGHHAMGRACCVGSGFNTMPPSPSLEEVTAPGGGLGNRYKHLPRKIIFSHLSHGMLKKGGLKINLITS